MNPRPDLPEVPPSLAARVQMVMRVVEVADHKLSSNLPWAEQFTLRMVRAHYLTRLRGVLAARPEVRTWSGAVIDLVRGFSSN